MKFNEFYFKNILSFNEVKISLDQINLIVGPNNSGKTNILRVLELFSKNDLPLSVLRLHKSMKNNPEFESVIGFDIELSDLESKMLFQLICKRQITNEIHQNLRRIRIVIKWGNLVEDNSNPTHIIIRFENSLTAIGNEQLRFFGTIQNNWEFLADISLDDLWKSGRQFAESEPISFKNIPFQEQILSGRKFLDIAGDKTYFIWNVKADLENNPTSKIDSDIFNFLNVEKTFGKYIIIWYYLGKILANNISIIKDVRPGPEVLADSIHKWRDLHENEYQQLKLDFTSLFPNTTFHLRKIIESNETTILISEKERNTPLVNSASGYFAGLYLLFTIYGEKEHTLFLDEPETHFHPSKLSVLSNKLSELSSSDSNQMTIITHSPILLDFSMLQHDFVKVIYLKRNSDVTEVFQPNEKFIPKMKSYHFDSSVFFERGCIIVEGPSDEYTIKAISDSYNQLLKKSSIALVNAGGKDQIEPFIILLKEYGIPYVAMVDSDYAGISDGVIKLEQDLEYEFEKFGWKRKVHENGGKEKIRAEKAYSFIIDYLKSQSDKTKFEKSSLWQVIQTITR